MENIIFLRVSSQEQDEKQQLEPILKEFNLNKDKCLIINEKQSAFKEEKEHKRDGLKQLKKELAKKQYKKLFVFALDRLFRNRTKQKEFLEFLKLNDIELYSYSQKFLNDIYKIPKPYNEIVYNLLIEVFGHMAEEESRIKSLRVKKAYDSKNCNTWGRPKKINNKEKIVKYYNEVKSLRKTATEFKISLGSVQKIIKEETINK